jgi:hypothetical protein
MNNMTSEMKNKIYSSTLGESLIEKFISND